MSPGNWPVPGQARSAAVPWPPFSKGPCPACRSCFPSRQCSAAGSSSGFPDPPSASSCPEAAAPRPAAPPAALPSPRSSGPASCNSAHTAALPGSGPRSQGRWKAVPDCWAHRPSGQCRSSRFAVSPDTPCHPATAPVLRRRRSVPQHFRHRQAGCPRLQRCHLPRWPESPAPSHPAVHPCIACIQRPGDTQCRSCRCIPRLRPCPESVPPASKWRFPEHSLPSRRFQTPRPSSRTRPTSAARCIRCPSFPPAGA